MTAIVGILCGDGVVVGTDGSATFAQGQFRTIEQPTEKLHIIGDRIILAGTGQVGFDQRFRAIVNESWTTDKLFQREYLDVAKTLTRRFIEDLKMTYANIGQYGALMAFDGAGPRLCEFSLQDFQPEFKNERIWYCSMGSAQAITDPFLAFIREVFWQKDRPSVEDAIFAATWTLEHAVALNPGGVNEPIGVAVLERQKKGHLSARVLGPQELDQHRQHVQAAKESLGDFRREYEPDKAQDVPRSGNGAH